PTAIVAVILLWASGRLSVISVTGPRFSTSSSSIGDLPGAWAAGRLGRDGPAPGNVLLGFGSRTTPAPTGPGRLLRRCDGRGSGDEDGVGRGGGGGRDRRDRDRHGRHRRGRDRNGGRGGDAGVDDDRHRGRSMVGPGAG